MNVVKVYCGLGNQLYQYAFGCLLKLSGMDVAYDTTWFDDDNNQDEKFPRLYRLDKFNIDVRLSPFLNQKTIFPREYKRLSIGNNCNFNFNGFWQDLKYCESSLPILRKELFVRQEFYTEEFIKLRNDILDKEAVSVHVRRGDSLTAEFSVDYYLKSIDYIKSRKNVSNVFIFSDDIPWCRENFKDVVFVDLDDYLSFELMRLCKHNIMSSSSFSRFASLLNDNANKIAIYPKGSNINVDSDIKRYAPIVRRRMKAELIRSELMRSTLVRSQKRPRYIPNNWILL